MTIYIAPRSADWADRDEGWFWTEIALTANLALHDTLVFMSSNNNGWAFRSWQIAMPQLDTNASPTLLFDIGFINNTGNLLEPGLEWEQNLAIGRTAGNALINPATSNHMMISRGRGRRIGLHVAAAAATPVFAGKVIHLGLQLQAI